MKCQEASSLALPCDGGSCFQMGTSAATEAMSLLLFQEEALLASVSRGEEQFALCTVAGSIS